jgi:hypothetical protein
LIVSTSLSERKEEFINVFYAPLMGFYRLFLRFPRAKAYIEEFLGVRYEEPFYPREVWEAAPKWVLTRGIALFLFSYFVFSFLIVRVYLQGVLSLIGCLP